LGGERSTFAIDDEAIAEDPGEGRTIECHAAGPHELVRAIIECSARWRREREWEAGDGAAKAGVLF
jgi:hypothetical protein